MYLLVLCRRPRYYAGCILRTSLPGMEDGLEWWGWVNGTFCDCRVAREGEGAGKQPNRE